MARTKVMTPPSPSSSGTESKSSSSSDGGEQQKHQPQKELVRAKASPSPVKKKPVVVSKQQQSAKLQDQMASPIRPQKSAVKVNKKPSSPLPRSAAAATATAAVSSSDEEASDSPLRTNHKPVAFSNNLRPLASTEPSSPSKPKNPSLITSHDQPRKAKEGKRPREEKVVDKKEGDAATAGGSSSKKLFQRLWTQEDEIALLAGMLNFQEKHGGSSPALISDSFCEFISSFLRGDFSKVQFYTKIRNLKNKYLRNLLRGKDGADPSFSKHHEQVAFELSKKLWPLTEGDAHDNKGGGTNANPKGKGKKMGRQEAGSSFPSLTEAISLLGKEDDSNFLSQTASRGLENLKFTKAKTLDDRWSKHFTAGVRYSMERAKLKKDLLQSLAKVLDSE